MRIVHGAVLAGALAVSACAPAISGSAENIAQLEQARAANPKSEPAQRSLGIAFFKAKRYDDARTALQQAAAADPNDGVAALYLGLTAEAQNDLPAARAAYENYLRVGKTARAKNQISDRLAVLKLREVQVEAKEALAREQQLPTAGPANAVAVMPFSFTGADTSLKPLERGFAELITTDLSRSPELTVVERMKLQALLDEIHLQNQSNVQGSGIRAGRLLQVGKMVGGSIVQQGEQLRANAIVTDLSTTRVGQPASDQETMDQLFTLEKNIVFELFSRLGVTLTTAQRDAIEQRPTRSLAAFLAYSRGLQAEDQGHFDDAGRLFDNALRLDPNFGAAQQKSREAKSAAAGANVNVTTVEASLRGTSEGAAVASAGVANMNTTGNAAVEMANGLNPSTAAGATGGVGSSTTEPTKDPSAATGGDNVTTKTTTVTIVVHQPAPGKP